MTARSRLPVLVLAALCAGRLRQRPGRPVARRRRPLARRRLPRGPVRGEPLTAQGRRLFDEAVATREEMEKAKAVDWAILERRWRAVVDATERAGGPLQPRRHPGAPGARRRGPCRVPAGPGRQAAQAGGRQPRRPAGEGPATCAAPRPPTTRRPATSPTTRSRGSGWRPSTCSPASSTRPGTRPARRCCATPPRWAPARPWSAWRWPGAISTWPGWWRCGCRRARPTTPRWPTSPASCSPGRATTPARRCSGRRRWRSSPGWRRPAPASSRWRCGRSAGARCRTLAAGVLADDPSNAPAQLLLGIAAAPRRQAGRGPGGLRRGRAAGGREAPRGPPGARRAADARQGGLRGGAAVASTSTSGRPARCCRRARRRRG